MTPQPPIPVRFVLPRARRRARAPVLGLLVSLGAAACGDVEAIDGPDGGLVDGDDPSLYAAGTTRYEAEARTRQNDAVVATNNPGYTGSGFMDYGGTGSWIEWSNINAAAAGAATVTVRYANGGASERPIALVVNGAAAGTARVPSTGACRSARRSKSRWSSMNGQQQRSAATARWRRWNRSACSVTSTNAILMNCRAVSASAWCWRVP